MPAVWHSWKRPSSRRASAYTEGEMAASTPSIKCAKADYWKLRAYEADCVRDQLLLKHARMVMALAPTLDGDQQIQALQVRLQASSTRRADWWARMARTYRLDTTRVYATDDATCSCMLIPSKTIKKHEG